MACHRLMSRTVQSIRKGDSVSRVNPSIQSSPSALGAKSGELCASARRYCSPSTFPSDSLRRRPFPPPRRATRGGRVVESDGRARRSHHLPHRRPHLLASPTSSRSAHLQPRVGGRISSRGSAASMSRSSPSSAGWIGPPTHPSRPSRIEVDAVAQVLRCSARSCKTLPIVRRHTGGRRSSRRSYACATRGTKIEALCVSDYTHDDDENYEILKSGI